MSLSKNFFEIISHPTSLFALLGLILLIIFVAKVKNIKFTTHLITQIGIALALATILKMFRLYQLPQGGSVTLGSMIPIILMALFYGPEVGFITGFLYGMITLILDPYILHPVQVLFDYPLPFIALGLAGYFKNNKLLATFVAVFARFLCHFISGVVFFGSFAPKGMSPAIYSLIMNGIFIGIEGTICLVIMAMLPVKQLSSMMTRKIPQN
jgi:thiamine transporter